MSIRKLYISANEAALKRRDTQKQLLVTIATCKAYTDLSANLLYFGKETELITQLEDLGVKCIAHESSFNSVLKRGYGDSYSQFAGHWLRCDIPLLESDDDFVLYTDIDVMFTSAFAEIDIKPKLLACSPEHRIDDFEYFNSGVMVINVPVWRDHHEDFVRSVERRVDDGFHYPPHDQRSLNDFAKNRWDWLPNIYNWKPYWGSNDEAAIVHFHGVKPDVAAKVLNGADFPNRTVETIMTRSLEGYNHYVPRWFNELGTPLFEVSPPVVRKDRVNVLRSPDKSEVMYTVDQEGKSEKLSNTFLQILEELNAAVLASGARMEGNLFYLHRQEIISDERPNPKRTHKRVNFYSAARSKQRILEVGFNAGHSALLALSANDDAVYHGVDIFQNKYTEECARVMKRWFGDRFIISRGDSRDVLPAMYLEGVVGFDLVHIDGGHGSNVCIADMANGIRLVAKDALLMLDDTGVERIRTIFESFCNKGFLKDVTSSFEIRGSEQKLAEVVPSPFRR